MEPYKQFYYKKNCLQQLKGFCLTVQNGSISKAAEKMGLNQSTVTLQIQSIERDLETQLFDRNKKRIKLNEQGKIFYEMVSCHINGIDSLYKEFLNKKNTPVNQINMAVHHVAISHLLPPLIKKFQEQNPKVVISIKNIAADDAIKRLEQDEVDLILYPNIDPPKEFHSSVCFSYNPVLIMHKDHPLAKKSNIKLQDISTCNTIRIDKKLISLPLFEDIFKEFGFKTNIDFENGSWEIIKSFVKAGIGVGFISDLYINDDDRDLVVKRLNDYFPIMEYKLVVKSGKHLNITTQNFIKTLVEKD